MGERARRGISEGLAQPGQAFDGIVVVGRAGLEAEVEIEAVGDGHGGGRGIEVDVGLPGGDGAINDGIGECSAEREAAGDGADPEALEFPGVGGDGDGQGAPGNEAGGLGLIDFEDMGDETAAGLFEVAVGKARGFLLKRAESEAGCAGLCDDKAAVFEQEFAGLGQLGFWRVGCKWMEREG